MYRFYLESIYCVFFRFLRGLMLEVEDVEMNWIWFLFLKGFEYRGVDISECWVREEFWEL